MQENSVIIIEDKDAPEWLVSIELEQGEFYLNNYNGGRMDKNGG